MQVKDQMQIEIYDNTRIIWSINVDNVIFGETNMIMHWKMIETTNKKWSTLEETWKV